MREERTREPCGKLIRWASSLLRLCIKASRILHKREIPLETPMERFVTRWHVWTDPLINGIYIVYALWLIHNIICAFTGQISVCTVIRSRLHTDLCVSAFVIELDTLPPKPLSRKTTYKKDRQRPNYSSYSVPTIYFFVWPVTILCLS